jgi:hypothetical protein
MGLTLRGLLAFVKRVGRSYARGEWMNDLFVAVTSVLPLAAAMALLVIVLRTVRVRVEWREDD